MPDAIAPPSTAPALSESALGMYRTLLGNDRLRDENPEWYNRMKASIDNALAVTGQSLAPPPVHVSPAEHHAQKFGVVDRTADEYPIAARDFDNLGEGADKFADGARVLASALRLPPTLARVVADQIAAPDNRDPEAVRRAVEQVGHRYDDLIRDVDALIRDGEGRIGTGIKVRAKDLSPHALIQTALWARHVARMRASAPKA